MSPDSSHPGDFLAREKIDAARRTSDEGRFLAGPRLFDDACRIALDGLRGQFPDADDGEVRDFLRERLTRLFARSVHEGLAVLSCLSARLRE